MAKILDLNAYRDKLNSAPGDNEILQEVVNDACKEIVENAVWIAKDLDVDITSMDFIASLSGVYHYYSQALEIGLGIQQSSSEELKVIHDDVKNWVERIKEDKGEGDE